MICGGCSKVACQLSTEFPATDTSKPGHKWQCCTNAHVDFFLTPASTFTCECLWKAFQPYMYYKIHWIWQAHTLAHALSWVFPYAHTHLFLLHDITYMHSSLNTVPNNISRMCRWITAIKALTNRAWTQTAVTAVKYWTGTFCSILIPTGKQSFTLTLIHKALRLSWTAVCFNTKVRKISK